MKMGGSGAREYLNVSETAVQETNKKHNEIKRLPIPLKKEAAYETRSPFCGV
jgi:hypothetical protein